MRISSPIVVLIPPARDVGSEVRSSSRPAGQPCTAVTTVATAARVVSRWMLTPAKRMPQVPGPIPRISGRATTARTAIDEAAAALTTLNQNLAGLARSRNCITSAAAVCAITTDSGGR